MADKHYKTLFSQLAKPIKYSKLSVNTPEKEIMIQNLWNCGLLIANGKRKREVKNRILGKPFHSVFKLTLSCNLRCKYCYVNTKFGRNIMSLDVGKRAIDELLRIGRPTIKVLLHGGEPLLEFDLIKKLYYYGKEKARRMGKNIIFSIQTNGTIMNDDILSFIKKENMQISISLDCLPNAHNACRPFQDGSSSWNKIMSTLDKLKKEDIPFLFVTVVTKLNVDKLPAIIPLMKKYNVKSVTCNPLFFGGRGSSLIYLGVTAKQYFNGMKKLLNALIKYNYSHMEKKYEINMSFLTKNLTIPDQTYMCLSSPCGAGLATFSVSTNGDIYPCDEFITVPQFKCGNIMEKSLDKLLNSNAAKQFRLHTVEKLPNCQKCSWKHYCAGGCPSKTFHHTGSLYDRNPFCGYYKRMVPYLFYLLAVKKIPLNFIRSPS